MLPALASPPQEVYRDPKVVASYLGAHYLEDPEQRVIQILRSQLTTMSMLDIAIGTGRTTEYFASLVKTYVGVDYSETMIDTCRKKLATTFPDATFAIADMRNLNAFPNHSFDFVLISYNAISAMSHEDRQLVYREVHRVCKSGGYFFFSAHNLQSVDHLFGLSSLLSGLSPLHPKMNYWHFRSWFLRRFIYNAPFVYPEMKHHGHFVLNDGAHEGRLQHYYIKPAEQCEQLKPYFENIRVFKRSGYEVEANENMADLNDAWLFYLCNHRSP